MAMFQVLLIGKNWKLRVLIYLLLLAVLVIVLETLHPGILASLLSKTKNALSRIYDHAGSVFKSWLNFAREIIR